MLNKYPVFACGVKILILALLYIACGKLGLLLAVPPGYATVIWPASGIAIGMLLTHGWKLWPGILIGSFLLNCHASEAFSPVHGFVFNKTLAATGIALGSTLQGMAGYWLARRLIGLPLKLNGLRDASLLLVLCGPAACVVAATAGVMSLHLADILSFDKMMSNWITWWLGDVFGVLVFLPLMLIAPASKNQVSWRGNPVGALPVLAMLVLVMPLGLTFYAWKIAVENAYEETRSQFETLTKENEKALLHRIDSYNYALLGAAGFFQGSENVSRSEWRAYAESLSVEKNFPGINGIGVVFQVAPQDVTQYLRRVRNDDAPEFKIHPDTENKPNYIITYIEPASRNELAIGLNIGFEENRRQAAELARDTGHSAITKKVTLVQDETGTPGFLLLHPLYEKGKPVHTVEQRRKALTGWVYAPFIAKNFMNNLTNSQHDELHLEVYDGVGVSRGNAIFDDGQTEDYRAGDVPQFVIKKRIKVMQQDWTLVWKSTKIFEARRQSDRALLIMVGGLAFTGLFGVFLIVISVRNAETIERVAGERMLALPVSIFLVIGHPPI